MLSLKNVLLIACGIFTALSTFAQHGAGNNGFIVKESEEKFYLLDFFEGGIHESPYSGVIRDDAETKRFQERAQSIVDAKLGAILAGLGKDAGINIISKLASLPPVTRDQLLSIMSIYTWSLVSFPLIKEKDIQSIVDLSNYEIYAGAIRLDNTISISGKLWKKLDSYNQVGLILHELIYAMVKPKKNINGTYEQSNWDARIINRAIFTGASFDTSFANYQRNGEAILTMFDRSLPIYSNPHGFGDTLNLAISRNGPSILNFGPILSVFLYDDPNWGAGNMIFYFNQNIYDYSGFVGTICSEIMDKADHSATISADYFKSEANLIDYMSPSGPNKYIDFKYREQRALGVQPYTNLNTTLESPGKFKFSYSKLEECLRDLPAKISILHKGLLFRYDFQEVYSK